eukprot:RCo002559
MKKAVLLQPGFYRNAFEPAVVDRLEDNLNLQLKDGLFDLEANLALLKLYQLFPERANVEGIRKVLLKSLMYLKDNAFTLALYLIPDRFHSDAAIVTLMELSTLLECAKYSEFWEKAKNAQAILQPATNLNHAIRDFILDTIFITYRTVDVAFLLEALNLDEGELKTYLGHKGMKSDGGFVTFSENDFTTLKPRDAPQDIQFDQIAKIF